MTDTIRRSLLQSAVAVPVLAAALSNGANAAEEQEGVFYVIAEIVSKPDTADRLRDLLVPFAASSADEPGCLEYTLMEVESEPGRFLTYERWTDPCST